ISDATNSCTPNSMYMFDMPSFAFYIRAGKTIKRGEQIFISYHEEHENTFAE
ncbi:hypothetical protein BDQ17DRAFT_1250388, partial [Cyathus striatus]